MTSKNAAHELLFDNRNAIARVIHVLGAGTDVPKEAAESMAHAMLGLIDILELQIRRIDELEHM